MKIEQLDIQIAKTNVKNVLGGEFIYQEDDASKSPLFIHINSGHRFRYIPGGEFVMGLSDKEELAARRLCDPIQANISEMRPLTPMKINPFLITERPILNCEIGVTDNPKCVAYVEYDQAERFAKQLNMSLPSEAQWEYACRSGSTSLFTFGDDLPDEATLEQWLTFDFSSQKIKSNAFGLQGLYVGEWCLDYFSNSYDTDRTEYAEKGIRVVRGGGAFFWPWQGEEWVWCMSAMRCPSTDLPEGMCGFRFVRSLQK